jgi:hypothetical protein
MRTIVFMVRGHRLISPITIGEGNEAEMIEPLSHPGDWGVVDE